jgi:hypothetical protein
MAILRGTDVMRDSSVIAEGIGRKGLARRSPRNDNRGNSCEGGNQRFFDCVGGRTESGSEETALAAPIRMTTAKGRKTRVLAGKCQNNRVGGIEARSGSKKLMTMIDKTKRVRVAIVHRLIAQNRRWHTQESVTDSGSNQ